MFSFGATRTADKIVQGTVNVRRELTLLSRSIVQAQRAQRGYLITGREIYLEPYRQSKDDILGRVDTLQKLTEGNRNEEERLKAVRRDVVDLLTELESTIDSVRRGQKSRAYDTVNTDLGERLFTNIQINLDECVKEEDSKLFVEVDKLYQAKMVFTVVAVVSFISLVVAVGLVCYRLYKRHAEQRGAYGQDSEGCV